jgi:hypothetical protein
MPTHVGNLGRNDAAHHTVRHLDNGYVKAGVLRHGGYLEADVAGANHHKTSTRPEVLANTIDVGNAAQVVNAFQLGALYRKLTRA